MTLKPNKLHLFSCAPVCRWDLDTMRVDVKVHHNTENVFSAKVIKNYSDLSDITEQHYLSIRFFKCTENISCSLKIRLRPHPHPHHHKLYIMVYLNAGRLWGQLSGTLEITFLLSQVGEHRRCWSALGFTVPEYPTRPVCSEMYQCKQEIITMLCMLQRQLRAATPKVDIITVRLKPRPQFQTGPGIH